MQPDELSKERRQHQINQGADTKSPAAQADNLQKT